MCDPNLCKSKLRFFWFAFANLLYKTSQTYLPTTLDLQYLLDKLMQVVQRSAETKITPWV